jgi:hypothetical protein
MSTQTKTSTESEATKICFCSVTQGRENSSIVNAISAIKMQMAMMKHPVNLEYRFEDTLSEALDYFYANKNFDVLVAVDSHFGFSEDWVVENALRQKSKRVVTGVFPIPGKVDWERIRAKAADDREPNSAKGHVYNIDISSSEIADGGEYAIVERADLRCLVLKRGPLEALGAVHPERVHSKGILVHEASVGKDGEKLNADETLCKLLKDSKIPIYADLERPITSFGSQTFAGVCGIRKQLR